MSNTKWTKNQEEAITSKGSVLVSASAGTGKTAVLTERVVNQILSGIDVENILVMTFSAKAAEEMKTRIARKLDEALETIESEENSKSKSIKKRRVISQINALNKASIQTIHSFCCDVIKTHYYKVGIDPKATVCSGADVTVFKKRAIDKVLDPYYEGSGDVFSALYDYLSGSETLEDSIISSHKIVSSILDGYKWLDNEVEKYNIDETTIPGFVKEVLLTDFNSAYALLDEARESLASSYDEKLKKPLSIIISDMNIVKTAIDYVKNDNIIGINPFLFKLFGGTIRFPDGYGIEKAKRDAAKELIKPYKDAFYMDRQLHRIKEMYPMVKLYAQILKEFDEAFQAEKRAENVIDFADMEHMAYQILQDSAIADSYKGMFRAIYVDEYQDTSPVQEAIINSISSKDNLFCVGDLKQSIYRFRSSDPLLFKHRMTDYSADSNKKVISLSSNFRSSANVLNCANDVFSHITMSSREIVYSSGDVLVHGRSDKGDDTPVHVEIIDCGDYDKEEAEIANICKIIKNRVGKPVYDSKTDTVRPAKYSDFAILSRKVLRYTTKMNHIFHINKIPFQIEKAGNLFDTAEIELVLTVLRLVSNRNDDVSILTVMHNHMFEFTDDDIMKIRAVNMESPLIENIIAASKEEGELSRKCADFLGFLDLCSDKQHQYSLTKAISYVIDRTNILDLIAIMDNGEHRIENVKMFINFASQYEHTNHGKMYSFLKYVECIRAGSETVTEAKNTAAADAVTITSIHQSKGLEYPIVILAFMGTDFSSNFQRKSVIIDRDAGVGFRYYNTADGSKGKTLYRTSVERIVTAKDKEEEMRLLYVAMTRAKEELYIQGIENRFSSLYECNSMLSWVCSSVYNLLDAPEDEDSLSVSGALKGSWEITKIDSDMISDFLTTGSAVNNDIKSFVAASLKPVTKHIDKPIPIPKAISASSIDNMNTYLPSMLKVPKFMTGTTAADVGDSVHRFLRYASLDSLTSYKNVISEAERLLKSSTLSEEDVAGVRRYARGIASVCNSKVFSDMKSASKVFKEKHLYTGITNPVEGDSDIVVRCIADLAYELNDSFVIIDYKTDYVTDDNIGQLIDSHRSQLKIYSDCFIATFGKPISGMYLAMLGNGKTYKVE